MKKIISLLLLILMLTFSVSSVCFAADAISVELNEEELEFDQDPVIVDGRTLVPLRVIFESLGATVEWEGETQTITATKDDIQVVLQVNNYIMFKNDEELTLDVPPQIIGSRTLVPVRAISESFNCNVEWDGENRIVKITTEGYVESGEERVTIYSADGETKRIKKSELAKYILAGWYATEPYVTMYSMDGRTISVKVSEVEAYEQVGWYTTEPTVTMYAIDGRTIEVKASEVEAYGQVGWYMSAEEAAKAGELQGNPGQGAPGEGEPQEPEEPEAGSGPRGEKPQKPEKPDRPPR